MHTGISAVIFTTLLAMAIMTAGCSSLPFPSPGKNTSSEKIDIGFSSVTEVPIHETYRFENVMSRLSETVFDADNNLADNIAKSRQILYIRAMQPDTTGNADSWMLVVRHGNNTSLVTYDKYGETITRWNSSPRSRAIPLEYIQTPGQLFNRSHSVIFGEQPETPPDRMILELENCSYTLTISGRDKVHILEFDAITGALKHFYE